jgi:glycosyltransferase involved in cell wall biosynthesis
VKVLHIITGLGIGGAELQLDLLLRHTRHDADVVTLCEPGAVADMLRQAGVRVRDIAMRRNTNVGAVHRLHQIIRNGCYDVVHTHLYRSQLYGHLAARAAGTPVIVTTEHSIGDTHIEGRRMSAPVRALYLAADRCSHRIIAVSDVVRDRLVRWGVRDSKITVIPNGVDTAKVAYDAAARTRVRAQLGISTDARVIGVLGRLDPNKRVDLVIRAAAPLLGDDRLLVVVGEGKDRRRLEQIARDTGMSEHVRFAGQRGDVGAVLSAFDLFVAASEQETFGLAMLEALSNGLPVLYTTCPALDGVASDRARRVTGDVDGLRREIDIAMGRYSGTRVPDATLCQRYDASSVARRIDDLYERLASRGAGPAPSAAAGAVTSGRGVPPGASPPSSAAAR